MEDIIERFTKCVNNISNKLNNYTNFISNEYILDFTEKCTALSFDIDSIINENRVLRVGIVGEVKAGKSSFINSLIFDGEDILPKAATPMTAALTKLNYGVKSKAKIVFYSDYDWKKIKKYSECYDQELERLKQEYYHENKKNRLNHNFNEKKVENALKDKIPEQYKSCKELTEMAVKNIININEYLNKSIYVNLDNIENELNEYIGANGKYTAIVKHIELTLDNTLLKDIELIDTPGLNDPILSRSDTTKKFLKNCDVVFLLSYAGQFLTNEDIRFITSTLPEEGIGRVILIGSKLDSAILDYPKRKATLKEALMGSVVKFNKLAEQNVKACLNENYRSEALIKLKDSLPPKYTSSVMYSIAKKNKNNVNLSEFESHIYKTFKKRFVDFNESYDFLMELACIEDIKTNIFKKVASEKERIIKEKSQLLLKGQKGKFLSILEDINIQANQNLNDINNYDKQRLQQKLNMIKNKMSSIRREVKNIFDMSAVNAKKVLNDIALDIEKEVSNYTDIGIKTHNEEYFETLNEGLLGLKKKNYRVTKVIYSASVSEVISNLRRYITRSKRIANEEFEKLINVSDLKKKIKETIIGAFDLSDKNFEENDILIPIEIVMKKIKIPSININVSEYDDMILRTFSSYTLEGEMINELLAKQEFVLQKINKNIEEILNRTAIKIEAVLQEEASKFVDNIISNLSSNIKMIETRIEDKENSVREFETFIAKILSFKKEISNLKV